MGTGEVFRLDRLVQGGTMPTSIQPKKEEVGLVELYLSGMNFAHDITDFIGRPEVRTFLLNASICLTFLASIGLLIRVVAWI